MRPLLLCLAILLALPSFAAPPRSPDEIKAAYSAAIARLDQACETVVCRDPETRHLWELAGAWLTKYLDEHEAASAEDLEASLAELDPRRAESGRPPSRDVLALGEGDFLVTLQLGETGTFLVVGRGKDGVSRVKWSIDAYAGSSGASPDLRCWKIGADCGPLYGAVFPLPPTRRGQPRFYVKAGYAGNGMAIGGQTSVWVWTGHAALPQAVVQYTEMIEDERPTRLEGDELTLPIKENPEGYATAGADADPKGVWTLRLTPDGVRNLGHRWSDPELQWLDRFLTALQKGGDTRELASPEVVQQLKLHQEEEGFWGMLMQWSVQRGPTTFLRATIEGTTYSFMLKRTGDRLFATAVTIED